MIGTKYWATGISLAKVAEQWSVQVEFFDDGFSNQASTEGVLKMRYLCDDLSKSIDILIADAAKIGIEWKDPTIYYRGDGEWKENPPFPGWEQLLADEAARLGWRSAYT